MARYHFVSLWEFDAPLALVWEAVFDSCRWPEWWPSVLSVQDVQPGRPDGIGHVRRYAWRGRLPYTLRFDVRLTEVDPLRLLAGQASGEVEGTGRWRFSVADGRTRVEYDWDVRTVPGWMNLAGPLSRPLVRWNHDGVMAAGRDGLARYLAARLAP